MNNDGGPAFPTQDYDRGAAQAGFAVTVTDNPGMSLRDWFAGQALVGLLVNGGSATREIDAANAFKAADAMIAAREGGK